MFKRFTEYKYLVKSDLCRLHGKTSTSIFLKNVLTNPGFKYLFIFRTTKYLKIAGTIFIPFYVLSRFILRRYSFKYGISIPYNTNISSGFYIGHYGCIVVHYKTVIGRNCNISHGVTIGEKVGGKNPGIPVIGDNVYIAPGAKIIGGIRIGNNVAVGANSVIADNIPDNAVVIGIPGKVISHNGSKNYIQFTNYQ